MTTRYTPRKIDLLRVQDASLGESSGGGDLCQLVLTGSNRARRMKPVKEPNNLRKEYGRESDIASLKSYTLD